MVASTTFRNLLRHLGPEEHQAAEEYRRLHERLTRFFEWRDGEDPPALADEAMDRLAKRLESTDSDEAVRNPSSFVLGIARLMLHEESRRQQRERELGRQIQLEANRRPPLADRDRDEQRHRALDHCLARLPGDRRTLVETYYLHQGQKKIESHTALAESLGLNANALRNRILRTRRDIESCMREYLARG